ncbi:MAG TPA: thiamine pyrophosphate-dependent enzyme, partial [Anaerolineales bacterium]|nr:thiamine pyrophosphate-dependent enzyme [Anaerolineales bacterium]
TVVSNATGCVEVCTSVYPFTAWNVPWIHNGFENAAATITGAEAAYRAMERRGDVPKRKNKKPMKFIALGGDGGTYDIGLQSLSGALERGHDFVYICYDNGAYMNTGIQRSSASPFGANTTTSPAGVVIQGKQEERKNLTAIAAAHDIPFVATASPGYYMDFTRKVKKALDVNGPAFLNVFAVCPLGWRSEPEDSQILARSSVETCVWPLYEIEDGRFRLTFRPNVKRPVTEYMQLQGRFSHLFKTGNEDMLTHIQERVDAEWEQLLKRDRREREENSE